MHGCYKKYKLQISLGSTISGHTRLFLADLESSKSSTSFLRKIYSDWNKPFLYYVKQNGVSLIIFYRCLPVPFLNSLVDFNYYLIYQLKYLKIYSNCICISVPFSWHTYWVWVTTQFVLCLVTQSIRWLNTGHFITIQIQFDVCRNTQKIGSLVRKEIMDSYLCISCLEWQHQSNLKSEKFRKKRNLNPEVWRNLN